MKHIRIPVLLLAFTIVLCGMAAAGTTRAEETPAGRLSASRQIVYSCENGLPCGKANDIARTPDGMVWVGTYAGLYRFDGQSFQWMNGFDSVRNVNTLYTDADGRLWIGTSDNGLSVLEGDQVIRVIDPSGGLPSWSVRSIVHSSDGYCYVGTGGALTVLSLKDHLTPVCTLDELTYATGLSADSSGLVAAVSGDGTLFLLRDGRILSSHRPDDSGVRITCCQFDPDGRLLVGTGSDRVRIFDVSVGELKETGDPLFAEGLVNIHDIMPLETGELLIAADNGIGLIGPDGLCTRIDTGDFSNSIDRILLDGHGGLWLASSRLGLLHIVPSAFRNICAEAGVSVMAVNAVTRWNGIYYIGTDYGLYAVSPDSMEQITDELTEMLTGRRIRSLMVDRSDNLWIADYTTGILRVAPDRSRYWYDRGNYPSVRRSRVMQELSDGTVAVGSAYELTFLRRNDTEEIIQGHSILSLTETDDGRILAGTDGDGILVISDRKVVRALTRENGLTSDVILRTVPDPQTGGVFVVTSNGLCYMAPDETIRVLRCFPYYNNYDLRVNDDGTVFVMSSAGVFVVDREDLLSGSSEIRYRLLNYRQGLDASLTPNSWQYYDKSAGKLLLACDTGVYMFDPDCISAETEVFRIAPDPASSAGTAAENKPVKYLVLLFTNWIMDQFM